MIKRNVLKIDKENFNIKAWTPALVKHKDVLEKVQQRATKWVQGLKNVMVTN